MRHITEGVYGLVMSRGIANGRAGTRANGGMSARTAGTGAASVKGPDPKARPVYREVKLNRSGEIPRGFAFMVHTNHAVPTSTRKRTQQVPFLVVVK